MSSLKKEDLVSDNDHDKKTADMFRHFYNGEEVLGNVDSVSIHAYR